VYRGNWYWQLSQFLDKKSAYAYSGDGCQQTRPRSTSPLLGQMIIESLPALPDIAPADIESRRRRQLIRDTDR